MLSPTAGSITAVPTRRDWISLAVLSVGLGVIVLDGTIVGVALPAIITDLKLDITQAQWVNSLYAVVLAALLLSTGKIADSWGRKRAFLAGLSIFVAGSVWAGFADSAGTLISARAVQAVGAAFIMPSTLSTVNAVFRGKYRAAAFGVWGAVISGAAAVGPLAGGALTQWVSWHWIFLVNVPIGIIVAVGAVLSVRETRSPEKRPGVDVDGAQLSAIAFGALVFAVIEGPSLGWWTPQSELTVFGWTWPTTAPVSAVPVALLIAAISFSLFIRWEEHRERVQRSALLDLGLFSYSTFSWGNITAGAVAIGEFAIIFILPLYLINALGLSVMSAGLVLAAMAIGAFISGAAARHVAGRFGAPGTVLIGLGLEVVGALILAMLLSPDTSGWVIALPLVLYGVGLGFASAQLTGTVLSEIPVANSGQASATQSTVRQIGSSLGTAVSGSVFSVALALALPKALEDIDVVGPAADAMAEATRQSAGSSIAGLRAQGAAGPFGEQTTALVQALSEGMSDAARWSLLAAVMFLVLGVFGALQVQKAAKS
ncbi:DHA2 family efflux MFS transporter permease subunit [Corynebacterium sp. UMB6689]|uniref:DHA2 family efflux MFS transporter permease subunit n=1 Tax=Corynebacterium sp. UMB6689 TaxID=3046341 RepID=UPI00254B426F|nr:DHA2 family efflux MFS transporter permease subunit [Corynebacterium sp. UMB6689]MDK6812884.1 DHA2 family efflux MFS transporter permease subunit [Corynebacterium sp. UMB6689]